jgi:hypothetical protein
MARDIARMPSMRIKLGQGAVNQSLDAQAQWTAIKQLLFPRQMSVLARPMQVVTPTTWPADAVAAQSRPSSSAFFVANSSSERMPR